MHHQTLRYVASLVKGPSIVFRRGHNQSFQPLYRHQPLKCTPNQTKNSFRYDIYNFGPNLIQLSWQRFMEVSFKILDATLNPIDKHYNIELAFNDLILVHLAKATTSLPSLPVSLTMVSGQGWRHRQAWWRWRIRFNLTLFFFFFYFVVDFDDSKGFN